MSDSWGYARCGLAREDDRAVWRIQFGPESSLDFVLTRGTCVMVAISNGAYINPKFQWMAFADPFPADNPVSAMFTMITQVWP